MRGQRRKCRLAVVYFRVRRRYRSFVSSPVLPQRLDLYAKLMRLDKPIGTLLLLWPTLWALWLATNGGPDWKIVWCSFSAPC